jgi:hypothetical protein
LSWTPIDKLALPSDDTSHISFGYNKNQGLAKPKLYSISVCPFTQGERKLFGRTLYGIVGLACGLILLNYGFSLLASGFPGLLELTSQFLGANLLLGGSIAVFISVYFLLKPPAQPSSAVQPSGSVPDVGVELVVEETPPSQYSFYKHIEYVGYFFTALGLFSAVDLVLQVLIPALYNEARWWVEILLATFGVLSYAIFGSVGRLGAQEEGKYVAPAQTTPPAIDLTSVENPRMPPPSYPETLQMHISEFSRLSSGDYERQVSPAVYDMFRIERETVTVWRERREALRSNYLAGPYELSRKLMEEYASQGEVLRVGYLALPVEALRELMQLQEHPAESLQATAG